MEAIELTNPEFLFCENPIKTGDVVEDNRSFIYCTRVLSLIEVVPMDTFVASFPSDLFQQTFHYKNEAANFEEEFLLVFTQNNIALVNESMDAMLGDALITETDVIRRAWEFYESYLVWEDKQRK